MTYLMMAFACSDGWAILQEGNHWWLTHPPYAEAERFNLVDRREVVRALRNGGFQLTAMPFPSWGDACSWMNKARSPNAQPVSSAAALLRITAARRKGRGK